MEKFKFKKKYGQNFLVNRQVLNKIIENIPLQEKCLVLEIGCGSGNLTELLCANFDHVFGFEIDKDLEPILNDRLTKANYHNYTLYFMDFLKSDLSFLKDYPDYQIYVIANVPYYITTAIIEKLLNLKEPVYYISLMLQKEAASRFMASVGSKDYSSLAVLMRYYYQVKKILTVPSGNFYPVPRVDSVVLALTRNEQLLPVKDLDLFKKLIKDSFKYKGKTLKNNLKDYDLTKISEVLAKYHYDLQVRPYKLSKEIYCDIANNLSI